MTDLASIAGELYGLNLDAFTARRNAHATALRAGDRELADAVAALPKPSVSAWLVDQLVRAEPGLVSAALALGPELRAAQASFDRDALRDLGRRRREALGAAVEAARRVAADRGRPAGSAITDEVEQTLLAATADEDAAAAVRSGRLVRPLLTVGGEPVDLRGAVAAPGEELAERGAAARARRREPEPAAPGGAEGRAEKDSAAMARAERLAAERSATAARDELAAADAGLAAAAGRHEQLAAERDDALAEYERLEREVGAAERRRREAIRERDRASRRAEGAERVLARVTERLEQG